MRVYLDNAATTRVRPESAEAAMRVMTETFGNPSSGHAYGKAAADVLSVARKNVADALGVAAERLYFTSGGTESDNLAVISGAESNRRNGKHVVVSAIEHDAVLKAAEHLRNNGFEVTHIQPERDGIINPAAFDSALREDTALASVMAVNNETGAVNDIAAFAEIIRRRKLPALLHTDAVQLFGKVPFDAKCADLVTVSGHKLYAPKGIGALYVRPGLTLKPRAFGGAHESGLRAGTENLPAISAFSESARLSVGERESDYARVRVLRENALRELSARLPDARVLSDGSPYIISLSLPGYRAETLMTCLNDDGIAVSRSSACKKGARSHVLAAMRLPPEVIDGAIRVSLSRYTSEEEIMYFVERLTAAAQRLFHR